jgi:hypothetical protein
MPQLQIKISKVGRLLFDKRDLKTVFRKIGYEVADATRVLISRNLAGPSSPGQPPNSHSGVLLASVRSNVFPNGRGVRIRDTAKYAKFLETGATGGGGKKGSGRKRKHRGGKGKGAPTSKRIVLARPYLSAALDQKKASIEVRLQRAVAGGLTWTKEP